MKDCNCCLKKKYLREQNQEKLTDEISKILGTIIMVNQSENGLLNGRNGETLHLKDNSPPGSIYKEENLSHHGDSDYTNEKW